MTSWARELWKHDYIHQLSLKLGINENGWLKNLPMTGENKVHKRHVKTPPEKKTNCSP
jgi:hypothetical protein